MQCVILAGGIGSRLGNITKFIAKSMIDINGQPFIIHQLRNVFSSGIDQVLICVGYLGYQIVDCCIKSEYSNKIRFCSDGSSPLGTFGAILNSIEYVGNEFFILYGDSFVILDYKKAYESFKDKDILISIYKNYNQFDRSNIIFNNQDKSIEYTYNKKCEYIDAGVSILRKESLWKYVQYTDLKDVYLKASELNTVMGYEIDSRFYEIGSLTGLEDFRRYVSSNTNSF
jgi:NDP-sugar pyrophosphorylase family protein